MPDWTKKLSEMQQAFLLSVVFHLFLFLIFMTLRVGIDLTRTEFAEMTFLTRGQTQIPNLGQNPSDLNNQAEEAVSEEPASHQTTPSVDAPERRMLEEEESFILPKQQDKLTPSREPRALSSSANYGQDNRPEPQYPGPDHKSSPQAISIKDKPTPGLAEKTDVADNQQFYSIEGEAANRNVIRKVIPSYPPDLQKEAVVQVRFWVLPNGSVGQMIPIKKGDPRLEEITLKALKQWRFNELSAGAEQKNVEGVITFRYQLR
ncbi:hypothetical protein GF407_06040 [candidate division KSB1 bacterium]|nr:hypothetical protein [candidate division KSB1 bacterium]